MYEKVVAPPPPVADAVTVCWALTKLKGEVALLPLNDNVVELFGLPVPCNSVINCCVVDEAQRRRGIHAVVRECGRAAGIADGRHVDLLHFCVPTIV